ncbi:acetyl-CoA carboxylase [Vibrio sp.]|jgi:biotin carboxyl carrier protein|uniref:Biotin carboxyl carrier protein of acetyl-CoA carboxylase n=1 Tax=Vibrio viridaestus TaxID=2487322 RepID=A0A3N9TJI2_9VIBR|nr:acetyl-CoA carboxylase [Vibrio viridaestus]MDC0610352.1 acetyl-CoA carboxylase [Vibrio sp.]RQW64321.1 biotin carboxyl carrier domain-containing protein [Vibrio viridaestus]
MATIEIISPLPGVFYRRPAPDADVFIEPGQPVEAATTIGLIEVMKQFSELPADVVGTLKEFCVDDNGPVEPGQVVALVEVED